MGGGHVDAHVEDLDRIVRTLRQGASDLDGPAGQAPDAPDAGASTGAVAGALRDLGTSVVALVNDLDQMASSVASSRGTYQETDLDNANDLNRQINGGH